VWGRWWRPIGKPSYLRPVVSRLNTARLAGTVKPPNKSGALRLVVTQYETFRTDDRGIGDPSGRSLGHRPVHVDIIPLD